MKSYLNREEIEGISILAVAMSRGRQLMANPSNMGKEEATRLKTAMTHLDRWLPEVFKRVGTQYGEAVKKQLRGQLVWMSDREADRAASQAAVYHFTTDELDPALAMMMEGSCKGCTGRTDCPMMTLFTVAQVPEYDPDHPVCPWAVQAVEIDEEASQ